MFSVTQRAQFTSVDELPFSDHPDTKTCDEMQAHLLIGHPVFIRILRGLLLPVSPESPFLGLRQSGLQMTKVLR